MGQLDGVGGLRSADQPQLQGRDSAKVGITADHHGFRSKLQAASCLQGIGCAQSVQGSHEGGLLNNRSREFDPNQVWLGKNGIETLQASLISSAQRPNPAFQNAQPTDRNRQGWIVCRKPLEHLLNSAAPNRVAIHQINQSAGIEKGDHQSRSAANSASMAALLRWFGPGGKLSNQGKVAGSAAGAREA